MGVKRCTKCKEEKPLAAFPKDCSRSVRSHNGCLRPYCKVCRNAYAKIWYEANRERQAAYAKIWYEANRERVAERRATTGKAWLEARMAEQPIEYLLQAAKVRAAKRLRNAFDDPRGLFDVTLSDIRNAPVCPDCLTLFEPQGRDDNGRRQAHVRSLDRADSSVGYIPGNVHVICWHCNRAKGNDTLADVQRRHDACSQGGMIRCNSGKMQDRPTLARRISRMQKALTDVQVLSHSEKLTRSATWALDEYATSLEKLHD